MAAFQVPPPHGAVAEAEAVTRLPDHERVQPGKEAAPPLKPAKYRRSRAPADRL
jgi:hypothetical protein